MRRPSSRRILSHRSPCCDCPAGHAHREAPGQQGTSGTARSPSPRCVELFIFGLLLRPYQQRRPVGASIAAGAGHHPTAAVCFRFGLRPLPDRPAVDGGRRRPGAPGPGIRSLSYRSWHESTLLSRQPRQDRKCRRLCTRQVNELSVFVPAWLCDIKGQGQANLVATPQLPAQMPVPSAG